ncbi:hypothetical protein A3C89_00265 [Candidatus Kaiserbacteria bacterium RIFCSPHIGHO2_02_FULL_50_50]|uniref:Uncharacterized protein n=1 Tax=Candidatus Kaiserbacteria bacterium RIFCSPHIGHO2_02_FULL_50_50 TaxID=1798492 RepID=A0A1F6DE98_9BACT|nr:MAG: hypothetical protein A3C89_00265 [Candidatus Kaiserbacteria bacterium RIFCSPHIGHO2_02_FULL_50_50]OGG88696.1 MAG: hypothetical protein A3G62_02120 [Candidatus Kaiserbacteria bacterium RIFCSPLOWO2_12_FULL_50_10]
MNIAFVATRRAAVGDNVVVALEGEADWFHGAATCCGAVARVYVDVFTPKARRAVVGVAITHNKSSALRAGEVLWCPSEAFHSFYI